MSLATADAYLAAIVDSSFDAIVSKDLNSIITSWNRAAERLFGYTAEEAIGRSVLMLIPEDRYDEETEIMARIRRGEPMPTFDTIRVRKDGTRVPVSLTVSPIRGPAGQIVGASKIARDITAAKESERRIRLLMREVNHRVKNQFAVILSMVRETGRRTSDPQEFEQRVRDRIMALSRSHDLLVNSDWVGASLAELVEEHLRPFGRETQIRIDGPDLRLSSNAVQHLGMALHELGTNSAKYGALSSDSGRLEVVWVTAAREGGLTDLHLTWNETFSPPAGERRVDSSRKGFGTVVLQRVTPQSLGGHASMKREAGTVIWTLVAPMETVTSSEVE
ncbi:MAG: PAS domain S-box protein [Mesorhizobium sp.]|nr:PAS domain S-box protein [Mesorhizobium sp.]MCO5162940.1 PAS domain S-box protein [Mesorhizobium sp.]